MFSAEMSRHRMQSRSLVHRPSPDAWLGGIRDATDVLRAVEAADIADFRAVLRFVLETVHQWLDVEALSLLLFNGATEKLELVAVSGARIPPDQLGFEAHRPGHNITGSVFESGEPAAINDVARDPRCDRRVYSYWRENLPSGKFQNAALVPFAAEFECRGVFRAHNRRGPDEFSPIEFSKRDIRVLLAVADALSGLVGVIWERHSVAQINTAIAALASTTDTASAASGIVRAATQLSNSPASALYIVDAANPDYLCLAGHCGFSRTYSALQRFRLQGSISGDVIATRRSRTIEDLLTMPGVANRSVARDERFVSAVVVPASAEQIRGCLVVFSRDRRRYHRSTVTALENLGLLAGSILDSRERSQLLEQLRLNLQNAGHSARGPVQRISDILDTIRSAVRTTGNPAISNDIDAAFAELNLLNRRLDSWLFVTPDSTTVMGLNKREIALGTLIKRAMTRYQTEAARRRLSLHLDPSVERLPQLRVDPDKMELAFDNLIENAIKYSWKDHAINISADSNAREVAIHVTDRGLGVPEDLRDDIFNAVARSPILDRSRYIPGTGLGLQIVKNIIDAHKGSVSVTSTPFLGDPTRVSQYEGFETTFSVVLPIED